MITKEDIAKLRALLNGDISPVLAKHLAQIETSDCLDTIEAQQSRIEELEADLRHLADARQAHINAVDHYNRMFEIMRYKEPGGMNITAEYHAMNDCRSAFICAAQDVAGRQIARAALQPKEPS